MRIDEHDDETGRQSSATPTALFSRPSPCRRHTLLLYRRNRQSFRYFKDLAANPADGTKPHEPGSTLDAYSIRRV